MLHEIFSSYKKIITLEDNAIAGGMGSAVIEFMADNNYQARVKRLGIPDYFVQHGTLEQLHKECGYDFASLVEEIMHACKKSFALPAG
jgi:1-deoxy-D-xylulose-5-phosphate synthase